MKRFLVILFITTIIVNLFIPFTIVANKQKQQKYNYDTYIINYSIINEWENSQNISITIANTGDESIIGWALQYDAGGEISNLWNGMIYESNGSKYIIKNSGYNFEIEPNTSITFGYTLSGTNLIIPSEIKLCSNREEKLFGYEVGFNVLNDWETGFEGEIRILNKTDKPIEAWKIVLNTNFNIDDLWNAKIVSQDATMYELASQQWTTPIEPNTTMILGITASKKRDIIPKIENIKLTEVVINNKLIIKDSDIIIDDEDDGIYYKKTTNVDDVAYDNLGFGYIKNQLILTIEDNWTFQNVENYVASLDAKIVGYIDITNEYQIEFINEKTYEELKNDITQLKQETFIEYVSLNYYVEIQGVFIPNDTETANNDNWNLYAINAFQAWDFYNKMSRVKIGLIDILFEENHNDLLFEKVWNNDKIEGTSTEEKHGTRVAGIMASIFNNSIGSTGICPQNYLYGYALGKNATTMQQKAALMKVIKKEIKVINISLNTMAPDHIKHIKENNIQEIKNIENTYMNIANTYEVSLKKVLNKKYDFCIVVGAGNDEIDSKYSNYLNYIDDQEIKRNIIVVGAIEKNNDLYEMWIDPDGGSNYGERIDVVAPGNNILTTDINNSYYYVRGTSMAAPHVSGIAGMMYSVNPNISGFEVKEIIKITSQLRKVADNHGYEYGIADAKLAVSTAYYCNPDNADKIIFGKLKDFNDTSKVYSNTDLKVSYSYNGFTTTSIISSDENGEFELVIPKDVDINSLVIHIDGYGVTNTNILGVFFGGSIVIDTFITPIEASIYGTVTVKNVTTGEEKPQANYIFRILKDGEEYMTATTQADGTYKAQVTEYGLYTVIFDEEHQYEVYIGENMNYEANCELECDDEEDDTKLSGTGANLYCIITYEDNCNLCHYIDCEYIQIEKIEDEWPVFILLENVVYNHTYGSVGLKAEGHYEDNPVDWRLDTMRWAINKDYYYDIKTIEIHLTGTIYDSEENLCSDSIVFSKGNSVESHAVFL